MAEDLPLSDDVAELNREAQKAVDREIAARVELQASIDNRIATRKSIADGSKAATDFIDAYVNPAVPNPPPVAPDVAVPAPPETPTSGTPVFTDVSTDVLTPDTTSGGVSTVADGLDVPPPAVG